MSTEASKAAFESLYKTFPELLETADGFVGPTTNVDPCTATDARYRNHWVEKYVEAGGEVPQPGDTTAFDKEVGNPAQPCAVGRLPMPCCAIDMKVSKGSRAITLPIDPAWGDHLYILAEDNEDNRLYGEIEVKVNEISKCKSGQTLPLVSNFNLASGLASVEYPAGLTATYGDGVVSGNDHKAKVYITADNGNFNQSSAIQLMLMVYDMLMNGSDGFGSATSSLHMCNPSNDLRSKLTTTAFMPMDIGGKVSIDVAFTISTAGFGLSVTMTPEIKGKVGGVELQYGKESKNAGGRPNLREMGANDTAGEFLDLVVDALEFLKSDAEPSAQEQRDSLAIGASRVTISTSIVFDVAKFKLTEQKAGPGLAVDCDAFILSLAPLISIKGTLDILDAVLSLVSAPVAAAVRKARQALARGERINGQVKCELSLEGRIDAKFGVTVKEAIIFSPLPDDAAVKDTRVKPILEGGGKLIGTGLAGISLEAEGYFVKFAAGIEGTFNTAFGFGVRAHPEKGHAQHRFYYEGIRAAYKAHFSIGVYDDTETDSKVRKQAGQAVEDVASYQTGSEDYDDDDWNYVAEPSYDRHKYSSAPWEDSKSS